LKLLLVEDDADLAKGLQQALQAEGFIVTLAENGSSAKKEISQFQPDLIILDLGLPDMDGIQVLRHLRAIKSRTPALILTARDTLTDKVSALDQGADDFLAKPFDMPELLARLRVMARRLGTAVSSEIVIGEVVLDTAAHELRVAGELVSLPRREYSVLKVLMEEAGRVKTKESLENSLYDWGESVGSNTIEVHISNLRKKLPEGFIKTIRGVGYTIARQLR